MHAGGIVTLTTDFGLRDSYVAQMKGVGMQNPEGDGLRRPLGQDDEPLQYLNQPIQQNFQVYRLGPRLKGMESGE